MIEKILLPDSDQAFFAQHRDRRARIRKPVNEREFEVEFRSLGEHPYHRRRVIVVRVQPQGMMRAPGNPLLPIPFLLFADETVADRDDTLLPIVDEVMRDAAASYGIQPRRR
jgi:hypothetical protein